jgi:RNA polymerase sigma-70 factor (ECF subfamily)
MRGGRSTPGREPGRVERGNQVVEDRPPAEAELVSRARRGDADAYAVLVAAHQEMTYRTAYLVLGNAAEAQDAAQEAFVRAYRALDRFRDHEPFRPWLLRIAVNAARNRRRSAARRHGLELRVGASLSRDAVAPSAEASVLAAERQRALIDAVNKLSTDDRLVIGARYFLDLAEAEIATLLGIPRGTVKSRLSRARARLAVRLDGTDLGGRAGG